jgi:hypothetical protein
MEAEPPVLRTIAFYGYAFVFTLGIVMYVAWGVLYNSWNILEPRNLGVYSIVVVLLGFGVVGMLLYGSGRR